MIFSPHISSRASETLLPGQISYLKKRVECNDQDILRVDLNEGCFDHLVLIISTDIQEAQVEALILTSFGGKTLEERHPYNRRVRLFHLPIAPAPRHPDNGILLELDGDLKLPKQTYVKIDLPYTIPWSMLRASYRDLRSRQVLELKPRSFVRLLQYVESRLSTKPKLLRKTKTSRLVALRSSNRAQGPPRMSKLASTLWNILMVLMIMVAIDITLAFLRSLGQNHHLGAEFAGACRGYQRLGKALGSFLVAIWKLVNVTLRALSKCCSSIRT